MSNVPLGESDDGKNRPPWMAEATEYVAGSLSPERARAIEALAAEDSEVAAYIDIMRLLVEGLMNDDMGLLSDVSGTLGVPLDDFLPDQYETVAEATFKLLKGAVTQNEASAYAEYRREADHLDAHMEQSDTLDPRALAAVVERGLYPDLAAAETAVWKVIRALGPVLKDLDGPKNTEDEDDNAS